MAEAAQLLRKQSDDFELVLPVASTLSKAWMKAEMEQMPGLKPEFTKGADAALKGRSSTENISIRLRGGAGLQACGEESQKYLGFSR